MQTGHWCLSDLLDQTAHTDMEMSCDREERYVTEERGMEMSCDRGERYGDVM